jgi:hypothetical protein
MEPTTTAATATPKSVGLRYGLLVGLVTTIISFGLNAAGMENSPAKYLSSLVLIVGIVLAQRFYKANNAGFMSYGEGMSIGNILSLIAGLIGAVFSYIYINFIDNSMVARILEKTRSDMEAKGNMSDEQIDQAMSWTAKFMEPGYMAIMIIVMTMIAGLITSLIVSAILKHTRPEFE